jgi:hypothetical protein
MLSKTAKDSPALFFTLKYTVLVPLPELPYMAQRLFPEGKRY